ncbi:hypothetical protein RhiirA5_411710 [Rhizophagus irregularis]|uniref:Uncharacterized protein n=1 Tax=Rhizophagus irregularis TaxID=588596 RepID=A0A2N0Q0B2_9GLOM|nr:hypothetical protein RhiirA5_411710 [Rhizophagus irregularis]
MEKEYIKDIPSGHVDKSSSWGHSVTNNISINFQIKYKEAVPEGNILRLFQGANYKAPLSRSFDVSEEWVTKIDFYVFWEIIILTISLKCLALQAGAKHMKDILRKCRTLKEITKEYIRSAVLYHSLVITWKNGHKLFPTNNRTTISCPYG